MSHCLHVFVLLFLTFFMISVCFVCLFILSNKSIYISVFLIICQSVYMSVCVSQLYISFFSFFLHACPTFCLCVSKCLLVLSILYFLCLSVCVDVYLCVLVLHVVCLPMYLFAHLSVYSCAFLFYVCWVSVCPRTCLFICQYIRVFKVF